MALVFAWSAHAAPDQHRIVLLDRRHIGGRAAFHDKKLNPMTARDGQARGKRFPARAKAQRNLKMTRKPVTIRLAAPEHLPEVHRMLIALAAHHGEQATITPAALRRIAMQGPGARLIVAMLDESPQHHPVGYALLLLRHNMVLGSQSYDINHLFVQEPLRGQGIGRALIDGARKLALDEGRSGLTIGTHPENEAAALAYRAMGLAELSLPGPRFAVALT